MLKAIKKGIKKAGKMVIVGMFLLIAKKVAKKVVKRILKERLVSKKPLKKKSIKNIK